MTRALVVLLFSGLCLTAACAVNNSVSIDRVDLQSAEEGLGFSDISEQQCKQANGHWNECGSPCAGTGADLCIEMCQVQCECGGITGFGCPESYQCRLSGKTTDEMGVCIQEQDNSNP